MNKWLLRVAAGLSCVLAIGIFQDWAAANEDIGELSVSENVQDPSQDGWGSSEEELNSTFRDVSLPIDYPEGKEETANAQATSEKTEAVEASSSHSGASPSSEAASTPLEEAGSSSSEGAAASSAEGQTEGGSSSGITSSSEPPASSTEESQPVLADEEEAVQEEEPVKPGTPPAGPMLGEPVPGSIGLEGKYYAFVDLSGQQESNLLQEAISKGQVVASTHSFSASDNNTTYFAGMNPGVFSHFAANLQMGEHVEVMDAAGTVHTYRMTEQIFTDVFGQAVIPSLGKTISDVYINGSGEESIMLQYENGDQLVVWYGVLAS